MHLTTKTRPIFLFLLKFHNHFTYSVHSLCGLLHIHFSRVPYTKSTARWWRHILILSWFQLYSSTTIFYWNAFMIFLIPTFLAVVLSQLVIEFLKFCPLCNVNRVDGNQMLFRCIQYCENNMTVLYESYIQIWVSILPVSIFTHSIFFVIHCIATLPRLSILNHLLFGWVY